MVMQNLFPRDINNPDLLDPLSPNRGLLSRKITHPGMAVRRLSVLHHNLPFLQPPLVPGSSFCFLLPQHALHPDF